MTRRTYDSYMIRGKKIIIESKNNPDVRIKKQMLDHLENAMSEGGPFYAETKDKDAVICTYDGIFMHADKVLPRVIVSDDGIKRTVY